MAPQPPWVSVNGSACEPPYEAGRLALVLLYGGVLAVGLPANLLTLVLTWRQVGRRNVLGVYLCALSLCDLGYLCTLPLWAVYVGGGHRWPWSSAACKLTGYVFFNNMYISIFLLCCVSCDRYVAVVYGLEARRLRRRRWAALVALGVVLAVAAAHLPVFSMREGAASGGERRCFEPNQSSAVVAGFSYARFLAGFLLPLLLLAATNRAIVAAVQRSTGLRRHQKRRARRLAAAVVALFLVCFAPYHLVLLIRALAFRAGRPEGGGCLLETAMYASYSVSLGLSTVNSAANPVLYVLSSRNVRKELSRGLARMLGRRSPPPPSRAGQEWTRAAGTSSDPVPGMGSERQEGDAAADT